MTTVSNLRSKAVDRHRKRLFGDAALKAYTTSPEDGEAEAGTFATGWRAYRTGRLTDDTRSAESGHWQFEVIAAADWATSQSFLIKTVSFTVGSIRWRVKKVEKPIGVSLVWKIRAEIQ